MPKIEPFERYVSRYEEWFEKNKYVYESELLAVKKILPKGGEGIEIGVGTGRFAAPLGIKIGVEPSSKMARIAIERGIKVIKGVAEELPLHDEQFDFALMVTTVCFVDDVEKSFREIHRILKDGGYVVIGFVDRESELGKYYELRKEENPFYRKAIFLSVEDVVLTLKKCGFKNFEYVQTIFHSLEDVKAIEEIKEGFGEGSFVVVRAQKEV